MRSIIFIPLKGTVNFLFQLSLLTGWQEGKRNENPTVAFMLQEEFYSHLFTNQWYLQCLGEWGVGSASSTWLSMVLVTLLIFLTTHAWLVHSELISLSPCCFCATLRARAPLPHLPMVLPALAHPQSFLSQVFLLAEGYFLLALRQKPPDMLASPIRSTVYVCLTHPD